MISFTVKENHIGLAVSEILRYRQKKLTTLYNKDINCGVNIIADIMTQQVYYET